MDAYRNHSNWNTTANDNVTVRPAKLPLKIFKGASVQGTCPDYSAQFDLVYTFSAVEIPSLVPSQPPHPPLTNFSLMIAMCLNLSLVSKYRDAENKKDRFLY
jgi:hypothetical protein